MSFCIMLLIMLGTGIIGGIVNYLLPGNNPDPKKFVKPPLQCIVLGIGATLLVPLFLEIAQSKLMDDIRFDCKWTATASDSSIVRKETVNIIAVKDTTGKLKSDTTVSKEKNQKDGKTTTSNTGKNYLLWAAYCLLAAAAGFRFINMLINNVVKEEQLSKANSEKAELKKLDDFRTKNAQKSQEKEDKDMRTELTKEAINTRNNADEVNRVIEIPVLPVLPAVIHNDDPQKGRFDGKAESNDRKLSAKVSDSSLLDYYKVELTVESTNPDNPLTTDVIYYIHDSFSPSVFTYKPIEFKNGKAIEDEILSYGAFTVGVITDNGKTMLELDLAEDKVFQRSLGRDRM